MQVGVFQLLQRLRQLLHAAEHQQRAAGLQRVGREDRQVGQQRQGFAPVGRVGDAAVHAGRRHQLSQVGQRRPVQGDGFVQRLRAVGRPRRRAAASARSLFTWLTARPRVFAAPLASRARAASWTSAGCSNALFASLILTLRARTAWRSAGAAGRSAAIIRPVSRTRRVLTSSRAAACSWVRPFGKFAEWSALRW